MKSKNYIYIILAVIVIIFHEFILAMGYMTYTTFKYIITDVIPETFNIMIYSDNNMRAYKEYIKKYYGIVSDTFGSKSHYSRFWYVSTPFMEKEFSLQIVKGKVIGDTFYDTLTTDPKFQHLLSEWVKKQVGIEDDNVEFQFAGNFDNPYIEFDKITSLSEDYREIFVNTHNLYAWLCEVSSIRDLTDENIIEIAKNIRENYLLKAIQITKIPTDKKFGGRIRISSGENTSEKSIVYNVDFDINSLSDNFSDMEYRKYD